MISSNVRCRSGKCNNDWHQLSSLITGWIGWKFHEMVVLSDLREIVCEYTKYEARRFTPKYFAFL